MVIRLHFYDVKEKIFCGLSKSHERRTATGSSQNCHSKCKPQYQITWRVGVSSSAQINIEHMTLLLQLSQVIMWGGVELAHSENEYQEHFLVVKAAGA